MRLQKARSGHRFLEKVKLTAMGLMSGKRPPDVVALLLYRPEFFGREFCGWVQGVLRGPSDWSVGERECFAAQVSQSNQCTFCARSHAAVAALALKMPSMDSVLESRPAGLSLQARGMLAFVRKLAAHPAAVSARDVAALRALGIRDQAIRDGVAVCAIFCTINRIANALDFEVLSPEDFMKSASMLLRFGYRL